VRFIAPLNRTLGSDVFKTELTKAIDAQYGEGLNVVGCLLFEADTDNAASEYMSQLKVIDEVYWSFANQEDKTPPNIIYGLDNFEQSSTGPDVTLATLSEQVNLSHALRVEPFGLEWQSGLYEGLGVLKNAKRGAVIRFNWQDVLDYYSQEDIVTLGADQPYKMLKASGIPIAIALEQPNSELGAYTDLYTAATRAYDLTYDDYKELVYNSYAISALPDWGKEWAKADLDAKFAAYEQWAAWQFDQLGF
jgi:hypothetical protein